MDWKYLFTSLIFLIGASDYGPDPLEGRA